MNAGESGKHRNLQAFFTLVNITYNFSRPEKKDTLRPEKKDTVVSGGKLVIFFVVARNFDYDRKKKDTVICWREIGSFFVVAGNFHYDRKKKIHYDRKKKDTVVSGGKLAFFL